MDTCTTWELNNIIENLPYLDRNLWETARLNAYVVAQVNSTKRITQQDICKFKWETEEVIEEEKDYEISGVDIDRLKQLSTKFKDSKWEDLN